MSISTLPNEIISRLDFLKLNPLLTNSFAVEFENEFPGQHLVEGFTDVEGLGASGRVRQVGEGGYDGVHVFPRAGEHRPVTLTRRLTTSRSLWQWRQQAINWQRGDDSYARDIVIYHLNWYRGALAYEVWAWQLHQAWPSDWRGPRYNANEAATVATEKVVLHHGGLSERSSIFSGTVGEAIGLFH